MPTGREPTPSELQETLQRLTNALNDVQVAHGRLTAESSRNKKDINRIDLRIERIAEAINDLDRQIRDQIQPRLDSMRPKFDSVPQIVEETTTKVVERAFTRRELDEYHEEKADKKTLKMEAYKVVIGVIITACLGLVAGIVIHALSTVGAGAH
jgi:tetrahydromethanopterin S-methyltransferase subunit B